MDSALFAAAGTEPLAMNNHHKGCSPAHFQANTRLAAAFALLSTNHDRRGQPFVSTIEARKWPMWGVQWHPEKPVFEWGTVPDPVTGAPLAYEAINHSEKAQEMAQFMGGFFLAHAKQSGHTFPTQVQEEAALMYNFAAVPSGPAFVQSYFFTEFPAYEVYEARGGSGAVGQEQQRRKRRAALPSLRGS